MDPFRAASCGINFLVFKGPLTQTVCATIYLRSFDSVRWYRYRRLLNLFFFWDEDHCRESWIRGLKKDKQCSYF